MVKLDMMPHKSGPVQVRNLQEHSCLNSVMTSSLGKRKVHSNFNQQQIHTQTSKLKVLIKCKNLSYVSSFVMNSKKKKLTHFYFSRKQTSSFCVFVYTALIGLFPIKHHQCSGTAGPATGRTINTLCQAPSQMVLTLSWRA